jgi:death-on-curing protein
MTRYLTTQDIVLMHRILIQKYGGSQGIRDQNSLESAIYRPQSGYYDNLILQASVLFESLVINHPFIDGNKRIAFAATDVFLRINGYRLATNSKNAYTRIMAMFDQQEMDTDHIQKWLDTITVEL